jgi:predicted lipid carrier protein YhbT
MLVAGDEDAGTGLFERLLKMEDGTESCLTLKITPYAIGLPVSAFMRQHRSVRR